MFNLNAESFLRGREHSLTGGVRDYLYRLATVFFSDSPMTFSRVWPMRMCGAAGFVIFSVAAWTLTITVAWHTSVFGARDLLAPKEQEMTEIGLTQSPSFDEQQQGVPQSLFTWIKMAKGYEVVWDTFGRKGWYAQDPQLKPVDPGSVFSPETPAVYIVFEVAPLEDPAQFGVLWFLEQPGGQLSPSPVGKDVLEVSGHERYGFLELKRPGDAWAVGNYLAKIFVAPLGQQPFHAVNQVGVMRFTIAEAQPAVPSGPRP